jgi:hypothetical protein
MNFNPASMIGNAAQAGLKAAASGLKAAGEALAEAAGEHGAPPTTPAGGPGCAAPTTNSPTGQAAGAAPGTASGASPDTTPASNGAPAAGAAPASDGLEQAAGEFAATVYTGGAENSGVGWGSTSTGASTSGSRNRASGLSLPLAPVQQAPTTYV